MNAVTSAEQASLMSPEALRVQAVAALRAVLPAHAVLSSSENTTPYECDGLTAYRQRPMCVVLPETEAQVQAVLRTCHRLGVPVVARGAGTGLSGGAMPHPQGVTLSLAKFNQILKMDAHSRTAVVQVRCAQPGHQRGRRTFGAVLRARPIEPNRLHHWWQCGGKLRRRALPEIRPDPAQRAEGQGLHHGR